jgi:hypothetical protein
MEDSPQKTQKDNLCFFAFSFVSFVVVKNEMAKNERKWYFRSFERKYPETQD